MKLALKQIPWYIKLMPVWVGAAFPGLLSRKLKGMLNDNEKLLELKNMISFMDNAIENQLLLLDYFMRKEPAVIGNDNVFTIDVDFGYKDTNNTNIFYNTPADKPISHQVDDLFLAIRKYYTHRLIQHSEKDRRLRCIPDDTPKEKKLFEIYPFLGINTKNYDFNEIEGLFDKYFKGYEFDTPELRSMKLFDMLDKYPASVSQLEADYTYLFAGIKVYPPLGFDPWPDDTAERKKVELLYTKCIEKKIPITTHCSAEGFLTDPQSLLFTNPATRWKEALACYPELKLNFAHLGHQNNGSTSWKHAILELITNYEHVYTDFSFQAHSKYYYESLSALLTTLTEYQRSKLLYGSDFMMVLRKVESYNHYMNLFRESQNIGSKSDFCHANSERFLFG
jgi:hypothetical protein